MFPFVVSPDPRQPFGRDTMIEEFFCDHPMIVLIGAIILTTALVVCGISVPAYYAQEHSCSKKAAVMQTDYHFGIWEGCWIKQQDNTWVEYTTIRNVGIK